MSLLQSRSAPEPTKSTKPAFPWVAVFIILALALPITVLCVACRLKPSLRKYRTYAHRCHPLSPHIVDDAHEAYDWAGEQCKKDHPTSHTRSKPIDNLTNFCKNWILRRGPGPKESGLWKDIEKACKIQPPQFDDSATNSGANVDEEKAHHATVRRRQTASTEPQRTSAYLESIASSVINGLTLDGSLESVKHANEDLEAVINTCDNDDWTSSLSSHRGTSMPSIYLKPYAQASLGKTEPERSPSFTRVFDPPDRHEDQLIRSCDKRPPKRTAVMRSSNMYPASIFDEYVTASDRQFDAETKAKINLDLQPSPASATDATLQNAGDLENRSLDGYEAQDDLDNAVPLRDITNSTISNLDNDQGMTDGAKVNNTALPDYSMTGYYERSIQPGTIMTSTKLSPARNCTSTPRPTKKHRSRLSHARPSTTSPTPLLDNDDPFYDNPSPRRRPSRIPRAVKSPAPSTSLGGPHGGHDTLSVPRKRPAARKAARKPITRMFLGLDGSPEQRSKRDFTLNDLPSAMSSPTRKTINPFTFDSPPSTPTHPRNAGVRKVDTFVSPQQRRLSHELDSGDFGFDHHRRQGRSVSLSPLSGEYVRSYSETVPVTRERFLSEKRRWSGGAQVERRWRRSRMCKRGGMIKRTNNLRGEIGCRRPGQRHGKEGGGLSRMVDKGQGEKHHSDRSEGLHDKGPDQQAKKDIVVLTPMSMDGGTEGRVLARGLSKHRREDQRIVDSGASVLMTGLL